MQILAAAALILALLIAALATRSAERRRLRAALEERREAVRTGTDRALLEHPAIDLSKCFGCGACVRACPEEGVLDLLHGQAVLVRGAACVGHAACEQACPTGAIVVSLGDLTARDDVPVLTDGLEAIGRPGIFVAGEATAKALIQPATQQGVRVASEVARRAAAGELGTRDLDLLIVGAGPAGLAAALEAKRRGLKARWIDRESEPGGTVARYPRRKLVLTQPIELPLEGRLPGTEFTKEQLVELWGRLVLRHQLDFEGGIELHGIEALEGGGHRAKTSAGPIDAAAVCLAVGRRGTPRALGVPGESLPHVAYRLEDADAFQGASILVVGGGDSAIEAALALAEHNRVTLSYRRHAFFRLKRKNEAALQAAIDSGRLLVLLGSEVQTIGPRSVELSTQAGPNTLAAEQVFLLLGGTAPKALLEGSGVPFDPSLRERRRESAAPPLEGSLFLVLLATAGALIYALGQRSYYRLPLDERALHRAHEWLRPGSGLGLSLGILAVGLIAINLAYLWRRGRGAATHLGRLPIGSMSGWLSLHVATGLLALLTALMHAAFVPRFTVGGDAFWLLLGLGLTGAIGRGAYAQVPRAANGRELDLAEANLELERILESLAAAQHPFRARARAAFESLIAERRWGEAPQAGTRRFEALRSLWPARRETRLALERLEAEGQHSGVAPAELKRTLALFEAAERAASRARHLETWRELLGLWRYLHRWGALLLVLLILAHVVSALRFAGAFDSSSTGSLRGTPPIDTPNAAP